MILLETHTKRAESATGARTPLHTHYCNYAGRIFPVDNWRTGIITIDRESSLMNRDNAPPIDQSEQTDHAKLMRFR